MSNGFAEGPAQALRDFLLAREASVVTIFHPLTPEQAADMRLDYPARKPFRADALQKAVRGALTSLLDEWRSLGLVFRDGDYYVGLATGMAYE